MKALSRIRFGRLLVAGFAFLAIAIGNAASARAELIASYATGLAADYSLSNSGTTTTFETTAGGFVGVSPTSVFTVNPAIAVVAPIPAQIELVATTDNSTNPAVAGGSPLFQDSQGGFHGTYIIKSLAASVYGGVGTTLMSATFSGAFLVGTDGGNTITFSDSSLTGSVSLSTPVASVAPPESFSFSLVDLTAPVAVSGGLFTPFLGSDVQTQAATVVPEPSSLVIAGIGALGLIGYGLRRRKALGA